MASDGSLDVPHRAEQLKQAPSVKDKCLPAGAMWQARVGSEPVLRDDFGLPRVLVAGAALTR